MTQTTPDEHQRGSEHRDSHPVRNDEGAPDLLHEESIPTDGKDVDGEEMMKSVRNDLLKEPPPTPPRQT